MPAKMFHLLGADMMSLLWTLKITDAEPQVALDVIVGWNFETLPVATAGTLRMWVSNSSPLLAQAALTPRSTASKINATALKAGITPQP